MCDVRVEEVSSTHEHNAPCIFTIPSLNPGSGPEREVVERGGKKGRPNRRKSFVKKFKPEYNYALGEDVGWDMIMQMENCSLVGRVARRQFSLKTVAKWVEDYWKEALGEVPEVVGLTCEWFGFNL